MGGGGNRTPEVSLDASLMAVLLLTVPSALQPAHDPHRQKYEDAEGSRAKHPVDVSEHRQDGIEVGSQRGHEYCEQAVPQGRRQRERDQGARRGQSGDPGERRHHRAPHGEQAGNEDPIGPVPLVLRFVGGGARGREQPPARGSLEELASVPSCQPVDGGRRRYVRHPCEAEDRPEVEPAATGEERTQRHGGVGGQRRNEVLEGGEGGDQAVQRSGRQALEEPEKIAQAPACSGSATASTATPPPLPIPPIPPLVFPLTETVEYPLTRAPARFSRMSSR